LKLLNGLLDQSIEVDVDWGLAELPHPAVELRASDEDLAAPGAVVGEWMDAVAEGAAEPSK